MWQIRQPTTATLDSLIARQSGQPFSYPSVGNTRSDERGPPGFDHDRSRVLLGTGAATFELAAEAIRTWKMFPSDWTSIYPTTSPPCVGMTIAMTVHVFGLWWLNACRVVYVLDEQVPTRRFGFAYGTLPGHVERGEELFMVEYDAANQVWYHIRSFSTPRYWCVRAAYPLARRQQRRFVRDSQRAMQQFVSAVQ